MLEQFEGTINLLGNLSADRLVGALFVSLAIAITTAAIYRLVSRREPVTGTVLIIFVFLANIACMFATACFLQSSVPTVRVINRGRGPRQDMISYLYDHVSRPDPAPVGTPPTANQR